MCGLHFSSSGRGNIGCLARSAGNSSWVRGNPPCAWIRLMSDSMPSGYPIRRPPMTMRQNSVLKLLPSQPSDYCRSCPGSDRSPWLRHAHASGSRSCGRYGILLRPSSPCARLCGTVSGVLMSIEPGGCSRLSEQTACPARRASSRSHPHRGCGREPPRVDLTPPAPTALPAPPSPPRLSPCRHTRPPRHRPCRGIPPGTCAMTWYRRS